MTSSTLSRLALLVVAGCAACRGPEELVASVSARVFVVGVAAENVVQLVVDGNDVRGAPAAGSNVVSFSLALAAGRHDGQVTVLRLEDDDGERVARAERCGSFTIVVDDDGVPTELAIVVDVLEDCDEDAEPTDDGAPPDAGEGEDDVGGEGEGEDDVGGEGEGEGDDAGDPPEPPDPDDGGEGEGE